ncbi:sarcosine oxidase subunit gamma [Cohaesibacter celericrescens]|uniref:Sarcosine oxidase subunit gamma n=3 Tax=Cohaesibacter celericrescens TaxID=2067669 RepID=A0A2N5XVU8_9HYPH|nr:sarcosine oxidase subunit gamma family protein [Cohaesibacter celericrescens]PLW78619.1 sarcosine oxidase subunit gamma [Cohaesibacter celericrescens]
MAEPTTEILTAQSPLQHKAQDFLAASSDRILLAEIPNLTQLNLRGDGNDKAFLAGTKKAIGIALPTKPNSVAEKGDIAALWLGPDEWLIVSKETESHRLISTLKVMLSDVVFTVVDVSDNRTVLSLSGADSWAVLNKGAMLDFHPRHWHKGQCASSLYGRCQVIFWQRSKQPEFYLFVRSSFADYCASYILDAMREFISTDEQA